ncbi:MAG TPA: SCO1664 family protein, partial [Pilimelia sp.]|nr:SCO1664 family protein [Pilimelia sp.]
SARDEVGRPYALAHADDPRLAAMATFDVVANNADRKGGHVILGAADHLYGVDHGLCFHTDDKLRTVLWGWAGKALPDPTRDTLHRLSDMLAGELGAQLAGHLTASEVAAVGARIRRLLDTGRYPRPSSHRYAVPWPPM